MTALADLDRRPTITSVRHAVRHFTPNWFAATMGTGILAICLGQFPAVPWLSDAGETLWILNIALFLALTATLYSQMAAAFARGAANLRSPGYVNVLRLHSDGTGNDHQWLRRLWRCNCR